MNGSIARPTATGFPVQNGSAGLENDKTELPSDVGPPDGGREAWLTVAGACLVQFTTFGYINAFGVYQDFYTREFLTNKSASAISWIGSLQLFLQYAPGILVGKAFDAGYFHHTMISGSILYVFSMFMVSLTRKNQYTEVILSQGIGMGIGLGLLFLPSLSIISHYFRARRALAIGIVTSGGSLGGIIFPIMLNKISQYTSFANATRATAALVALLLFLANLAMKPRYSQIRAKPAAPRDALRTIFTDGAYTASLLAAFCTNLGIFFPFFYLQLYAIGHNINPQVAFFILAMLNAGSSLGRVLASFLAGYFGVYNLLILCLVISASLSFSLLRITSLAGIIAFSVVYGFTSGAYVSLIPALLGQLSSHVGELGLRMGAAFSVVAVAMLIGVPIDGALLTHDGERLIWSRSIVFCSTMIMAGSMFMMLSRLLFIRTRQRGQLV
ncbi:hypothetical protein HGRIS_012559 [Hohenbuehelia grisea]|uniref:Major facilitator superfamily (MFS) profile domain-containing protein n=1 Tax=Hohenbuehelia grisea TaxID=104357 RepID=A0ABR3ISS9_9AGAR